MIFILTLSETLLYLSFSILMGGLFLRRIPDMNQPSLHLPKWVLLTCFLAIPIFSFAPVWQIIMHFSEQIPFHILAQSIFTTFEVGKGWMMTFFASVMMFLFLLLTDIDKPNTSMVALSGTLFLIFMVSYSSHASSIGSLAGLTIHFFHFSAMAMWSGILFVVSWFPKENGNWKTFLSWFTPFSIVSVSIVVIAGLLLMDYTVPEYWNSWILPYGEALLVKHLLFVVILIFAFINGFVLKTEIWRYSWLQAESALFIIVFLVTGFLGQSPPPHQMTNQTVQMEDASPLFLFVFQGSWDSDPNVQLQLSMISSALLLLSFLFLSLLLLSYKKRVHPSYAFLMGIGWVITVFFSILFGIYFE